MGKKVILAVAGAGKTYHICHSLDPCKRNLILAYTHENIHNIQKELYDAYGCIPKLTTVMTFHSFVYHNLILPYEPSIVEHFNVASFKNTGICLIEPPAQRIKNTFGRKVPNPKYVAKDKFAHYVTKKKQYYCDNLSELALQVKKGRDSLVKRAVIRLNLFYDTVLIDEFQDFREQDYELIIKLSKLLNNVVMVGDYFQHSVSAKNNSGKPFKKRGQDISYTDFVAEIKSQGFVVDTTTLAKSRRCSEDICNYVTQKLGINIYSNGDHEGKVLWVDENVDDVLNNPNIVKLVYQESSNYMFNALNWSYSKGDTVDAACVILTDKFDSLDSVNFSINNIPSSTINKLYVAMTRSRGDLYLIKASIFKKIKSLYLSK